MKKGTHSVVIDFWVTLFFCALLLFFFSGNPNFVTVTAIGDLYS